MFDKLVDFLLGIVGLFKFWVVIDEFERGIVLTWGRPRTKRFLGLFGSHEVGPGLHVVWPFGIERTISDNIVPTTTNLSTQSLTTKDGLSIIVSAVITWRIKHLKKMLLEVEAPDRALQDSTYGMISKCVEEHTWAEICSPDFRETLTKTVRKKAFRWGIEVEEVFLADKTKSPSFRLLNE